MKTICKSLIESEPVIPYFQLYLDALNAVDESNYHLAVIYSITALESLVKFYISSIFDKQDLRKRLLRMSLRDLVVVILRLIIDSEEYDKLIEGITNAISLRNKVIHEANLNVSKEETQKALKDVREYCQIHNMQS